MIDNTKTNKWLDLNFGNTSKKTQMGNSVLIIDAGSGNSFSFDSYKWATGNDSNGRDPISWNLYGSQDGLFYELIDQRSDEPITFLRSSYGDTYAITMEN